MSITTPRSKALEVNLSETRQENIEISESFQWFLALSDNYWGIQQRTKEFVEEYHHPYVNYSVVSDALQKIAIGDYWLYSELPEKTKVIQFISDILQEVFNKSDDSTICNTLLHTIARFCEMMIQHQPTFDNIILQNLTFISELIQTDKKNHVFFNSNAIKQSLLAFSKHNTLSEKTLLLILHIAKETYLYWQQQTQASKQFREIIKFDNSDSYEVFGQISEPLYTQLFSQIESCTNYAYVETNIWFYSDIANYHRQLIDAFANPLDQFQYLLYLLKLEGMNHLREHLLWDLNKILRSIFTQLEMNNIRSFISHVFSVFNDVKHSLYSIILDCLLTIANELKKNELHELISCFEDNLISLGFVTPGNITITDQWKLTVNPNHLKNIRIWLEIIETYPSKYNKLLSALIVHLKLGGIFIFDTDLFQRDVTNLLNTNITEYFKQVKQLCRLFPIYFNEIGAEGELRDVSTAIDNISYRRDKLIHFLRKQLHIESNNSHIQLTEQIFLFWLTKDIEPLKPFLPADVLQEIEIDSEWVKPMSQIIIQTAKKAKCKPIEVIKSHQDHIRLPIEELKGHKALHKHRLQFLCRIYELLNAKYSFSSTGLFSDLHKVQNISEKEITELQKSLHNKNKIKSIQLILSIIEKLNSIVLDTKQTQGWEDIYYKRHVAFGIPSMYGKYREPKFEALGLIFKLEVIARTIIEDVVAGLDIDYITANKLVEITNILELYQRGMELNGILNQGFLSNIKMLRYSLSSQSFSLSQHINIFRFLSDNIKEIIHNYFYRPYDTVLKTIISTSYPCIDHSDSEQHFVKVSEEFYRDLLSSAFLVQSLDGFISKILYSLRNMVDTYSETQLRDIMTFNPDMVISPLYKETKTMDNSVFIGSKAFFQKKLYLLGYPVPPGFVITTEVFRRRNTILNHPKLSKHIDNMIQKNISKIERMCGLQLGNPKKPLLLSVRSGTAVSMPGAMNSFLNVGMNDIIAKQLSKRANFAWTSWDCYRRFLQSWGMSSNIPRDEFDQIMLDFKERYNVEQKVQFSPNQMKEIAYAYKHKLQQYSVHVEEDPFLQLKEAILKVFESWSTDRAIAYREHLQIADEWGTAVIVQKMVLGNINDISGTGVVFTRNPHKNSSGIHLYGDYSLVSQGEDVVGGLVHVLPISQSQYKDSITNKPSLETDYNDIYNQIFAIAKELIEKHGFSHQEIEFTFESNKPKDFYILQTRDLDIPKKQTTTVFDEKNAQMKLLAHGTGIGRGVLNGLVFFDFDDLILLREQFPDGQFILVKPDTVPDDIRLIFECDGLITARGGATSHAAVTAARLGKICIVNCNELKVFEKKKQFQIHKKIFSSGDKISIDGTLGNVYQGHYNITITNL